MSLDTTHSQAEHDKTIKKPDYSSNVGILKYESFWVVALAKASPLILPFCANRPFFNLRTAQQTNIASVEIPELIQKILGKHFRHTNFKDILIAALVGYFYRINDYETFTLAYGSHTISSYIAGHETVFSGLVPLNCDFNTKISFPELLVESKKAIRELEQYKTFAHDIFKRYKNSFSESLWQPDYIPLSIVVTKHIDRAVASDKSLVTIFVAENGAQIKITAKTPLTIEAKQAPIFAQAMQFLASMEKHLLTLLDSLTKNPKAELATLEILSEQAKQQILAVSHPLPPLPHYHPPLAQHLLNQASQYADNLAFTFRNRSISYQDFFRQAKQLAHLLQDAGLSANDPVVICCDRGLNSLLGFVSLLLIGATYIPVSPKTPKLRFKAILDDCKPKLLLSDAKYTKRLTRINALTTTRSTLSNFEQLRHLSKPFSTEAPTQALLPPQEHTAYVIYTSGSTGKPKGVMIKEHSLINLLSAINEGPQLTESDKFLFVTLSTFDASIFDMLLPLTLGANIVMADDIERRDTTAIAELINTHKISFMQATPSTWQMLLDADWPIDHPMTMAAIGEAITPTLAEQLLTHGRLFNLYGPTEACVYATAEEITNPYPIYIGTPLSSMQTYVVDRYHNLVPTGVSGELYLGGVQIAAGYLNDEAGTQAAFIPSFLDEHSNQILYKTGDQARWHFCNKLEYSGRIDRQIKLRGIRLELGEIEATILKFTDVKQCVVTTKIHPSGYTQLAAYLTVEKREKRFDFSELRNFIKLHLPDYMIPLSYIIVSHFPLSANGKVNVSVLPEPDASGFSEEYTAPRSIAETKMVEIWAELLHIPAAQLSIHDNFFLLGGHSLLAARAVARIRDAFQLEIGIATLLQSLTIAKLIKAIQIQQRKKDCPILPKITAETEQHQFPVTSSQAQLWFLDKLNPESALYNLPLVFKVQGLLNTTALSTALQSLYQRHSSLRTLFKESKGQPRQLINTPETLPFQPKFLRHQSVADHEILSVIERLCQTPFNLSTGPLFRATVIRTESSCFHLVFVFHHAIFDGLSTNIFIRELSSLYRIHLHNEPTALPPHTVQFHDFASWQNSLVHSNKLASQEDYWRRQLANLPNFSLRPDFPRQAIQTFKGGKRSFKLSPASHQALKTLALQEQTTLYVVLLTCFELFLSRYTAQSDIVIGTPVAGRRDSDVETLIGHFINMLVVRCKLEKNLTFRELLRQTHTTCLAAFENQDLPFERVVECIKPTRDASHNPLFQLAFIFDNYSDHTLVLDDALIHEIDVDLGMSKFDLTLLIKETKDDLLCTLEYNADLFEESTIRRLSTHFPVLIDSIGNNPSDRLENFELLNPSEHKALYQPAAELEYRAFKQCLHYQFELITEANPHKEAVCDVASRYTYKELNQRANRLANQLLSLELDANTLVPILCKRSVHYIVALLASMKAGLCYIPIDEHCPKERVNLILSEIGSPLLLVESAVAEASQTLAEKLIVIDDEETLNDYSDKNPKLTVAPQQAAYMIFTSGTTGKPKGVSLTHANLMALANNAHSCFHFTEDDCWSMFHSPMFDVSLWEIWNALLHAGKLVIIDDETVHSPKQFIDTLRREKVTILGQTPSAFNQLMFYREYFFTEIGSQIRHLFFCGEELNVNVLQDWFKHYGETGPTVINLYGPAEATVAVSYCEVTSEDLGATNSIIGKAFAGTKMYVLDTALKPVPIGIPGQLYIAGEQVGLGYFNRDELTRERFINNPFATDAGQNVLYKTGDIAKWTSDYNLCFLGRNDNQVKLRGFRIELGDIETCLESHPDINHAIVCCLGEKLGSKQLVAYLVLNSKPSASQAINKILAKIKQHTKHVLPQYMVPSAIVIVDKFPLNQSGKVDTSKLKKPLHNLTSNNFIPPTTELEKQIAAIWCKALKLPKLGIHDDFFDIGGQSLLAIEVLAAIETQFTLSLPVRLFFEKPTVFNLCKAIEERRQNTLICLDKDDSSLVQLKETGYKTPLFLVHPIGGTAFCFLKLARYLDQATPVYALQDPSVGSKQEQFDSVEAMSHYYLKKITSVQKTGPYRIIGYSSGAVIACEIARQLQEQSRELAFLGLLDGWPKMASRYLERDFFNKAILKHSKIFTEQFLPQGVNDPDSWLDRLWIRFNQIIDYRFKALEFPVHLFKASEVLDQFADISDDFNGWQTLAAKGLERHIIPGNHETMLLEPRVQFLAQQINRLL